MLEALWTGEFASNLGESGLERVQEALSCRDRLISWKIVVISFFGSEPVEHQIDHGHVDEVLAGLGEEFVVLAQTPISAQPSERALDDPTFGQNREALAGVGALDDLKLAVGKLLDPLLQLAAVGAVAPELLESRRVEANLLDHHLGAVAVLHAGRMHDHPNHQSKGVDDKMALTSFNLLASIIAARWPPFSVVLTDWLSMIAALGVALRPLSSRTRSWSLS